ncbi:50S ribosomal protein L29 [bacterium]|nr:50S ribosomal protein L29 [bacterium]
MKKKEKIREFSRLGKDELQQLLIKQSWKLHQLRFDLASGKVRDIRIIKETKKDVARIKTLLKTKEKGLKH